MRRTEYAPHRDVKHVCPAITPARSAGRTPISGCPVSGVASSPSSSAIARGALDEPRLAQPGKGSRMVLALAGDTMLGRGVAERLEQGDELFSDEVYALVRRADLFVLNLECCISDRGRGWLDPPKPFFFRAPPNAIEVLLRLGVDCVTLANNHALDFDTPALVDTLEHLRGAGISVVGAGDDRDSARAPARVSTSNGEVAVIAVTDHPEDFAAGETEPEVAYKALEEAEPDWLLD